MARTKTNKVSLPLADFSRALDLCAKFNLSSGALPGNRVQVVLSQALREMQPVLAAIKAEGRLEAAYHGGPTYELTQSSGSEMARRKDNVADRAGKISVALSETGKNHLHEIKKTFELSNVTQAAALAVRVYSGMLDQLWRGNHLHLYDKDENPLPYDTAKLKEIAARPWQNREP